MSVANPTQVACAGKRPLCPHLPSQVLDPAVAFPELLPVVFFCGFTWRPTAWS